MQIEKLRIFCFLLLGGTVIGALTAFSPHIDNNLSGLFSIPRDIKIWPYKSAGFVLLLLIGWGAAVFKNSNLFRHKKEQILIFFLLFSLQAGMGYRIELGDIAVISALFFILFKAFNDTEYKINLESGLLFLLLTFFLILSLLNTKVFFIIYLFPILKSFLVFFLIINLIRNREHVIFTIKAFFIMLTISAIIGIAQEILYVTTHIVLVGYVNPKNYHLMFASTDFGTMLRVPALTGWYLIFSNYLIVGILLGINLLLYSAIPEKRTRLLMYLALFLMTTALFLTFSRSAELAVVIGIIFSVWIRWRRYTLHFLAASLALGTIAYATGIYDKFMEYVMSDITLRGDLGVRLRLLSNGIEGWLYRHPFFGVGLNQGAKYTQNINHWPVHNMFVLLADEVGVFGLFVFLLMVTRFFGKLIFTAKYCRVNTHGKILMKAFLAIYIGLFVNLQFHPSYSDYFIFLIFGMFEGIRIVLSKESAGNSNSLAYTST